MAHEYGYQGTQTYESAGSDYNSIEFIAKYVLHNIATATLVKVISVTNSGGLAPVGLVDIQPLVNQVDGAGNSVPHSVIHNCPYIRIQGGVNAIIIDPQIGDTGLAVFADKDLSKVINGQISNSGGTPSQANPDSGRRFSYSDGLYVGGCLNASPSQYIQFNGDGITITSPTAITINVPQLTVNGDFTLNGTFNQTGGTTATFSGDVTAQGTSLHTHTHGGVQTGGGNTGAPN